MQSDLNIETMTFSVAGLKEHYRNGDFTPLQLVTALHNKIQESDNPAFISLLSLEVLEGYCQQLSALSPEKAPLFGVPFAIKDNIDLAGVPTTAGCEEYAYIPDVHAHVVQRLLNAGAIPMGKTNMDQFATGLVGVRSPKVWGACHNTLNKDYISGGSSSGSAVAVANGWTVFSLGTDTAGSGRVPASLNNIVGLKPSCGLISNSGVVPACKSIDCVSIFALTAEDANSVFDVAVDYDPQDPFARQNEHKNSNRYFRKTVKKDAQFSFGIPQQKQLEFFNNTEAKELFDNAVEQLKVLGGNPIEIDFQPFADAAKLLYEGPWVTERYIVVKELLQQNPDALLPVIRDIVRPGGDASAEDLFSAMYRLNALKQIALQEMQKADMIVTPTNGTIYTIENVVNNPIQLNSNLGFYTNFMNLLDFSAVAAPTGVYKNGVGFGITLFANAFQDKKLLSIADSLQRNSSLTLGATAKRYEPVNSSTLEPSNTIDVVVCGAHLEGLPLNWQLIERGAIKVAKTWSAPAYRLYALAGGPPFRPGMARDVENGQKIEVEIWRLPKENFGSFVAEIPEPLGIGKVQLEDGSWLPGFICEACGIDGAEDITHLGGWRNYIVSPDISSVG